jgi:hypothetical protein
MKEGAVARLTADELASNSGKDAAMADQVLLHLCWYKFT